MLRIDPYRCLTLIAFLWTGHTAFSDDLPHQKEPENTIEDFLVHVRENHPEIQRLEALRGQVDYVGKLELTSDHLRLLQNSETRLGMSEPGFGWETRTTIEKPFPSSGARMLLQHTWNDDSRGREESIRLTAEQDFWRNAFGAQEAKREEISRLVTQAVELEITEAYETQFAKTLREFFEYQELLISQANLNRKLADAKKRVDLAKEKSLLSIAHSSDIARARLEVLRTQAEIAALQSRIESAATALQAITGKTLHPRPRISNRDPASILAALKLSESHAVRRDQLSALQMKKADLEAEIVTDSTRPLIAGFMGVQSTDLLLNQQGNDRSVFIVGARLDMDLGNDSLKHALRLKALHNKLMIEKEATLAATNLEQQRRSLEAEIRRQLELIDLSREILSTARSIVQDESRRYKTGRSTLERLIDAESQLSRIEGEWLRQEISLRKLAVEFLGTTDQLYLAIDPKASFNWSLLN